MFTENGSKIIARKAFDKINISDQKSVQDIEGALLSRMVLKNLEFNDLENLPPGNILRIQELEITPHSLNKDDIEIRIENGRLMLPQSEPIVFNGTYQHHVVDMTVFAKSINLSEIVQGLISSNLFDDLNWMKPLSGTAANVDGKVEGTLEDLHIQGKVSAEKVKYKDISLSNTPIVLDLSVKRSEPDVRLNGIVMTDSGLLRVKKTDIQLDASKVTFTGKPTQPVFNLAGASKIGSVDIRVRLKGTLERPDINLHSTPPLPDELLLVMLATGKEWKGFVETADRDALSTDLAADFIDYFVLDGRGEKLANRAGIKDIQIELDKNRRGIGVSKDIINNVSVSYGVDETQVSQTEKTISQKVGGKLQVTDKISVGIERELKEKLTPEENTAELPNDKVMMEYKKRF